MQGAKLSGFKIAGLDGRFIPADAKIDHDTVIVSANGMQDPKYVRYGWANSPDCNLFDGDGLPASPFNSSE